MTKIYNLAIVLSFFGLWVSSLFSQGLETFLGLILIFTFGILHGSNDILLLTSFSNKFSRSKFRNIALIYIFTVIVALSIFYVFPIIGLFLFILFSAFHFGEQHWEFRQLQVKIGFKRVFYLCYGLFVLLLLFVLNLKEVSEIVESITSGYIINKISLEISFYCVTSILFAMMITLFIKIKSFRNNIFRELLYILVFAIIFKTATLIWAFTIYFILWHSLPSLFEQINFIYKDFNKNSILKYLKNAMPYWAISVIGVLLMYYIFAGSTLFYAVFFSFIAAVTFPHSVVIMKMFKNKKTKP